MRIIGIIPARMGSSRFPGKPMREIHGYPMVGHVYSRSKMSPILDDLYVATCDQEIADFVSSIGGKSVMTSDSHERATERTAEALIQIEKMTGQKADIVVMIQGDEPMLAPDMIGESVQPLLENRSVKVTNLLGRIEDEAEFENPNEVKVVVDQNNFAVYFSREPIPSGKKTSGIFDKYKQICVIGFRRDFLLEFVELAATPLEKVESIDMLRVIEHGHKVKMEPTKHCVYSVDTEEDLRHVEKLMEHDPLLGEYSNMSVAEIAEVAVV